MSEPQPSLPERLEYAARPPALPLPPGHRVLTFIAFLFGAPFVLIFGGLGGIAAINDAAAEGVVGLLFAAGVGLVLALLMRDPRRRRLALAGGLTGVGVIALLLGACFALLANANFH